MFFTLNLRRLALLVLLAAAAPAFADVFWLKSGGRVEGTVLQQSGETITIAMKYGTIKLDKSQIDRVEKCVVEADEPAPSGKPATVKPRLAPAAIALTELAKRTWATGIEQIPATVIDVGVLRNIPYASYRCGVDYEFNIYGDPDKPSCIEIGIYRELLRSQKARQNCVDFAVSILGDSTDATIVKSANLAADKIVRNGMTTEITPETAEDSYGGWWISIYFEAELDKVRASAKELENISVPVEKATDSVSDDDDATELGWKPSDIGKARVVSPAKPPVAVSGGSVRKPSSSGGTVRTSPSSSGGGRVYVRSYHRKDGTYVRAHTRSRPKRR